MDYFCKISVFLSKNNTNGLKNTIYKDDITREKLMEMYDKRVKALRFPVRSKFIDTSFGKTHVLLAGDETKPPLIIFHGVHAGAPVALEVIENLQKDFSVFALDTIGQASKSAETKMDLNNDDFANWINETMTVLKLKTAQFIGISYGAFLLQNLISHHPEKVDKAIFVVPSGLVSGRVWPSITKLSIPLMRFMMSKKEKHLTRFMNAFFTKITPDWIEFQKNILLGVKLDYRKPPLLKKSQIEGFKKPVYCMAADDDIFFPGDKAIQKCEQLFSNFRESHMLKNTRHIPDVAQYPEIEEKLMLWLKS